MKAWQCLLVAFLWLVSSAARADMVEISDPYGGLLFVYQLRWEKLAAQKVNVRIVGPCVSACTVLLGYIPRKDICVTPKASLGFHLATMQFATDQLWSAYPEDVRAWITKHGGLTANVLWLQPPDLYRILRKCDEHTKSASAAPPGSPLPPAAPKPAAKPQDAAAAAPKAEAGR